MRIEAALWRALTTVINEDDDRRYMHYVHAGDGFLESTDGKRLLRVSTVHGLEPGLRLYTPRPNRHASVVEITDRAEQGYRYVFERKSGKTLSTGTCAEPPGDSPAYPDTAKVAGELELRREEVDITRCFDPLLVADVTAALRDTESSRYATVEMAHTKLEGFPGNPPYLFQFQGYPEALLYLMGCKKNANSWSQE